MNKKRIIKNIIITACFIAVAVSFSNAVDGFGSTGAQILNLNSSARVTAMGNANAGLADDLNAVIYNPAGLVQLYGTELQFSHLMYFMDLNMNSVTFGQRIGKAGVGFKWKGFSTEDTARSDIGVEIEDFDVKFSQLTFGLGIPLSDRYSFGASINSVSEKLYDESAGAVGFDLGWYIKGYRGDSFGIVVRNIGAGIEHMEVEDKLPLKFVLAGGHNMDKFLFAWEAFAGRETDFGWNCGLEADMSALKLRAGYIYKNKVDITVGFGIPYKNWTLDYTFSPHQDLGLAHRVSLGYYF